MSGVREIDRRQDYRHDYIEQKVVNVAIHHTDRITFYPLPVESTVLDNILAIPLDIYSGEAKGPKYSISHIPLPVYVGKFDGEGRPDLNSYPLHVGTASAYVGRITYNGVKYVGVNLQKKWRQGGIYWL